jgi:mono/diheme cytochrome c family protein
MARGSWLRLLGKILIALALFVAVSYAGLVFTTNRMLAATVTLPASVAPVVLPADGDTVALERGRYLVDHAFNCRICHAQDFGGRAEVDNVPIGRLWAPNLTLGEGSATRDYTPTDWARAIRHGVDPTGRRLILMPSEDYYAFSDDDIGAVVAYIRSQPNVDRADEGISMGPVGRALLATGGVTFAYDKIDHAAARSGATPAATVEWGRVLGSTCVGCHGEGLSGGPIPGGDPAWPPASNLTRHATGLAAWARDDFFTALRQGRRPDGSQILPPMPWQAYAGLSDADTEALWLYLQSVPAKAAGGR